MEDAAAIGPEGDDVAEGFKFGEGFVYLDVVTMTTAFYGCSKAAET